MYVYLEVKKAITTILKSRTDLIDNLKIEKISRLQHQDGNVYLLADTEACKQVFSSECFEPVDMGAHIDRLLKHLNINSDGLPRFLRHSPLIDASDGHLDKRIEFSRVFEEVFKVLPASEQEAVAYFHGLGHTETLSSLSLARQYIDLVLSGVFRRLLGVDSLYGNISRNSRGLFDVFPDPKKIVPLTLAIDEFISNFPSTDERIPDIVRKNPYICLSMVVMGREPLTGLITSYVNSVLRNDEAGTATPRRVSPVNFTVRQCVAESTVLNEQLKPNDLVYLMLSGANLELSHSYRGMAFGHGAHFCIGYRVAKTLFENFKSKLDLDRLSLAPSKPRNEAFLIFH